MGIREFPDDFQLQSVTMRPLASYLKNNHGLFAGSSLWVISLVSGCSLPLDSASEKMYAQQAVQGCDNAVVDFKIQQELDSLIDKSTVSGSPDSAESKNLRDEASKLEQKIATAREESLGKKLTDWHTMRHADEFHFALAEAFLTYQLARCQMLLQKYPESIANFESAVAMTKAMNFNRFTYACYNSLALCQERAGNAHAAEKAKAEAKSYDEKL